MTPALAIAIVAGVGSLAGTLGVGWFTYRSAKQNTQNTRAIEDRKLDETSWEAQVRGWREDVATLREQRAEDRAEHEAHRRECAEQIEEITAEVQWLRYDRADQIRRDRARAMFEADIVNWIDEWLPRARALGLDVPDPPRAPDLPPLIDPEHMEPHVYRPGQHHY